MGTQLKRVIRGSMLVIPDDMLIGEAWLLISEKINNNRISFG